MLTSDLITASLRSGNLRPGFVRATLPDRLALAEQLIAAYRDAAAERLTAAALDESVEPLLDGAADRRFAKALRKLLDDRSTFSSVAEQDFPALRAELFAASAALLQGERPFADLAEFQAALSERLPAHPLLEPRRIYADLPENDCLLQFEDITAPQLLDRYNLALVQALLLGATHLDLTIADPEPQRLRRIFKYLRFFQLLATVEAAPGAPKADGAPLRLHLVVDGPASILEQSRRYGLQLASFFPAVCTAAEWRLVAEVTWRDKPATLELDQESRLVCPYHNFSAYVPDEIKLFHRHFQESVSDWKIVGHTPFLRGPGREVIIPDLSFEHQDGALVHLELFNRWHASGLPQRLAWLAKHPKQSVVLGVDRTLARKPELAEALDRSSWFAEHGFLYRDYPTVDKTRRALESFHAPHHGA